MIFLEPLTLITAHKYDKRIKRLMKLMDIIYLNNNKNKNFEEFKKITELMSALDKLNNEGNKINIIKYINDNITLDSEYVFRVKNITDEVNKYLVSLLCKEFILIQNKLGLLDNTVTILDDITDLIQKYMNGNSEMLSKDPKHIKKENISQIKKVIEDIINSIDKKSNRYTKPTDLVVGGYYKKYLKYKTKYLKLKTIL
jgi:hypothetical protein